MRSLPGVARILAAAVGACAGLIVLGLGLGRVFDHGAARGFAIFLYIVGAFVSITGLAGGLRGSLRSVRQGGILPTGVRRASPDEVNDAMASSALLIGIGFLILFAAVVVDPKARLW